MIRTFLASLVVLSFFAGPAAAQPCGSYPYTLANGTTADASQVMGNFNHVLGCVNNSQIVPSLLRGWIAGLTISNSTTSPNTVIDTSAGVANSDDATTLMTLAAFIKDANATWAVGSSNGCLDSGASLLANQWYHLFVIARTDTGVVDQLCSTSATTPTLPASYTKKRRIGSFKTNSSFQILAFVQDGDYFRLRTGAMEFDTANPGTAGVTATLNLVPTGVSVQAHIGVTIYDTTPSTPAIYVSELAAADEPTATASYPTTIRAVSGQGTTQILSIRTNTASQLRYRMSSSNSNTHAIFSTYGWNDTRGRFQ